jgi:putative transposase
MLSWHHNPFNVYCGPAIWPQGENAQENLAHYIVRPAFSRERMDYISTDQSSDNIAKVIYQSKNYKTSKKHQSRHTLVLRPKSTFPTCFVTQVPMRK